MSSELAAVSALKRFRVAPTSGVELSGTAVVAVVAASGSFRLALLLPCLRSAEMLGAWRSWMNRKQVLDLRAQETPAEHSLRRRVQEQQQQCAPTALITAHRLQSAGKLCTQFRSSLTGPRIKFGKAYKHEIR